MSLTKVTYAMIEGSPISVLDYGAIGDGTTDDTAAFNAALTAGKIVFVPAGTYIVDGVAMVSDSVLYSAGGATLKRKNNATNNAMVKCEDIHNFAIRNLKFDGNIANQTVQGSSIYIIDNTDAANSTFSTIENNDLSNNNSCGILVDRSNSLRINNNTGSNTTYGGIVLQDPVTPFVGSSKLHNIIITENEFTTCGVGIFVRGNVSALTPLGEDLSQTSYANAYIVVSNNSCHGNDQYGLACQGKGLAVTGNVVQNNGNSTSNGGMLFNCSNSTMTGNTVNNNYYYGVDVGFSSNSIVSGNEIFGNGKGIGQAIGLNAGATVGVSIVGNNIGDNGGVAGGSYQILASGVDGSLTAWAPFTGLDLVIKSNTFTLTSANMYGVSVRNNFKGVTITENTIINRVSGRPFQVYLTGPSTCIERNKVFNSSGTFECTAASAATMTIPDYGEVVNVTGTATVNNLYTTAQFFGLDKVCVIDMTNIGSGYTSAPTVSLVGAGGTNATGIAALAANGSIYGIYITDYGSGYTPGGSFAVGFSGGGGSSAAATAFIGCDDATDRVVVLRFASTAVIKHNVGNIYLNGTDFTGGTLKTLTLRGLFGNWYEVSRSEP